MSLLDQFLSPDQVSLKVCGVTRPADASDLVDLKVDAIGVNFWPKSKRFAHPESVSWLRELGGQILRVGVFVNESPSLPLRLIDNGLIDVVQLHGDEAPSDATVYLDSGVAFVKALGVKDSRDLESAVDYGASAILLDAHAPGIYGGTGKTMDWETAVVFKADHPDLPLILAGGIVPENAEAAAKQVAPAALDTASGVESAPGIKDRSKIEAMLAAIGR